MSLPGSSGSRIGCSDGDVDTRVFVLERSVEVTVADMTADDLDLLRRLEESLWRPETRWDREHMERVLAPEFVEFGRSGRIWSRDQILAAAPIPLEVRLPLPAFHVTFPSEDVALVTYRSDVVQPEPSQANRSSLWRRESGTWRLVFHQGTPVEH